MVMNREEIFANIQETLVDALGVDEEEVTEAATLKGDLGAEKSFNIKIPRGELFPEDLLNNAEYVENGRMTAVGLTELKKLMPHADFSTFEQDPDVSKMPDLFTVNTLVKYVENKLQAA